MCAHFCSSSQSEREEFEAEYKEKYERERVLLTEENKKLSSELDKVKYLFTYTRNKTKISLKTQQQGFLSCCLSSLVLCLSLHNTYTEKPQFPNPR